MLIAAALYLLVSCSMVFGWLLRGFVDRRMRPTSCEPSPEVTRIGRRWAATLEHLQKTGRWS